VDLSNRSLERGLAGWTTVVPEGNFSGGSPKSVEVTELPAKSQARVSPAGCLSWQRSGEPGTVWIGWGGYMGGSRADNPCDP
jgi:hypothetical protein